MNRELQKKIFKALYDFEALGDVMIEKEVVTLGACMSSSSTVMEKKILTTLDLVEEFKTYPLEDINRNARNLHEKEFIKVVPISTTGSKKYFELIETLVSLEEFEEDF